MSASPLVYCRPAECDYCAALAATVEARDARIAELDTLNQNHLSEIGRLDAAISELEQSETELQDACDKQFQATVRQRERAEKAEAAMNAGHEGLKEAVREALYKQSPWSVSTHDGQRTFIDLVFAADAVDRLIDRWEARP